MAMMQESFIRSLKKGETVIYNNDNQGGNFYSGIVAVVCDSGPLRVHVDPTDARTNDLRTVLNLERALVYRVAPEDLADEETAGRKLRSAVARQSPEVLRPELDFYAEILEGEIEVQGEAIAGYYLPDLPDSEPLVTFKIPPEILR